MLNFWRGVYKQAGTTRTYRALLRYIVYSYNCQSADCGTCESRLVYAVTKTVLTSDHELCFEQNK